MERYSLPRWEIEISVKRSSDTDNGGCPRESQLRASSIGYQVMSLPTRELLGPSSILLNHEQTEVPRDHRSLMEASNLEETKANKHTKRECRMQK